MSPLWIDHQVWILEDELRHLLVRRGPGTAGQQSARIHPLAGRDPATALQSLLLRRPRDGAWLQRLRVHVGEPWVRHACLPWQDGLVSDADWQAWGLEGLRQRCGLAAEDASIERVRVSLQGYGRPVWVAALDQALHESIQALARQQRLWLGTVEPLLALACRRASPHLKDRQSGVLMLQRTQGSVAWFDGGVCVESVPLSWVEGRTVSQLAAEGALMCGSLPQAAVHVYAAVAELPAGPLLPGMRLPTVPDARFGRADWLLMGSET